SPAEHRFRRDRVARALQSLAIALEEGDPAVLDDAHCEADHRRLGHQLLKLRIEEPVIDVLAGLRRKRCELQMGGDDLMLLTLFNGVRAHREHGGAYERNQYAQAELLFFLQEPSLPTPHSAVAGCDVALNLHAKPMR